MADRKLLLELCPKAGKVSMIPYRTIDGGGAVLTAVTLDRMEAVQGKRRLVYERPLVAASPVKLQMKNGCRVLCMNESHARIWEAWEENVEEEFP